MRKLFIICHGNLLLMTRLWLFGEATDVIACLLAHCHVKKMLLRKSCLPRVCLVLPYFTYNAHQIKYCSQQNVSDEISALYFNHLQPEI